MNYYYKLLVIRFFYCFIYLETLSYIKLIAYILVILFCVLVIESSPCALMRIAYRETLSFMELMACRECWVPLFYNYVLKRIVYLTAHFINLLIHYIEYNHSFFIILFLFSHLKTDPLFNC